MFEGETWDMLMVEGKIMAYFILVILILGTFFNINKRSRNIANVKIRRTHIFVTLLMALFFAFVVYKYNNTFLTHAIALSAVFFYISSFLAEGVHDKGFHYNLGTIFLGRLNFKEVDGVVVKETPEDFYVTIKARGWFLDQIYRDKDKDRILDVLEKMSILNGISLTDK